VLLRREQYRVSDAPDDIVRSIVSGKIANQRTVLQRALRDHGEEIAADRRRSASFPICRRSSCRGGCAATLEAYPPWF
jgi:CRISPR-associated protein Cas1